MNHLLSDPNRSSRPTYNLSQFFPRILVLALLMLSSLALITFSVSTIPFLRLPTSLQVVKSQIHDLKLYSSGSFSQFIHLSTILSMIFVWKQAFSIPGTILLNILIGAIYGTWLSTLLTCFLTAIGSTCSYQMARSIRPIILRLFPRPLKIIQRAVERFKVPGSVDRYDTAELSSYLLIARFLPVVPYSGLNLASGVLELPIVPFFWTLVIGSLPYNFLTTQVGDILSSASDSAHVTGIDRPNLSQIWSNTLLLKLAFVSLLGALPVLFKNQLREWIQSLMSTRRSLPLSIPSSPSRKAAFQRHQNCREWVSGTNLKLKTSSTVDQSDHPQIEFISSSSEPSSIVNLDHSDDRSELSRTTSSSSLQTDQERSPTTTLIINFDGSNSDPSADAFCDSHSLPLLASQTSLKDNLNLINYSHHLPLFLTKTKSQAHSNLYPKLAIQSLFDLPYRKVAKIVSSNIVPPK